MNSSKLTLGILLIATVAIGINAIMTSTANADKTLTCDTTKDCNVIIRKLKVGDDLIIQFKASPPSSSGSGGSTTTPAATVDQEARDDISGLKSADVTQDNELSRLTTENTALKGNLTAMIDKVTAQTNDIETLKAQVANISAVNPIIDINVTHPGENVTQPIPPVSNETTPLPPVANETVPPVSNETIPVPPSNETVITPPGGNETVITPPTNETVVVPPSNGTVIIPPENATVTPPANETVITPPSGNETTPDNSSGGFQPTQQ